jgi:hypothetical protein
MTNSFIRISLVRPSRRWCKPLARRLSFQVHLRAFAF